MKFACKSIIFLTLTSSLMAVSSGIYICSNEDQNVLARITLGKTAGESCITAAGDGVSMTVFGPDNIKIMETDEKIVAQAEHESEGRMDFAQVVIPKPTPENSNMVVEDGITKAQITASMIISKDSKEIKEYQLECDALLID